MTENSMRKLYCVCCGDLMVSAVSFIEAANNSKHSASHPKHGVRVAIWERLRACMTVENPSEGALELVTSIW